MQVGCYEYAIAYLSRYPKTSYELDKQLQKKGYEAGERELTLEKLLHIGLLDDRLYTEMYLRSEVSGKGKPLFPIQQKLYQKGIAKDIISSLVEEMAEELSGGQEEKIRKEWGRLEQKGYTAQQIDQKLQSRGYHYRTIQSAKE